MELALFIYFASVVAGLSQLFGLCGLFALLIGTGVFIYGKCEGYPGAATFGCGMLIAGFCSMLFACLIPSERAMYMMAGGYAVQRTVESPAVQAINDKVLAVINNKLDEALADLGKPKK